YSFHFVAQPRSFFDPQARAGADVQPEDACVNRGKKIFPEKEDQAKRQHTEHQETGGKNPAVIQSRAEQVAICMAEIVKAALEAALPATEKGPGTSGFVLVSAHDVKHHRRNQSSREQIRSQHGEA